MRIVSHTCSNTEIICALGCADWLVGVDKHSDYPPEVVESLPKIGADLDVDVARVVALRPDLVVTSLTVPGHERIVAALRQAGLPLLVCAPRCIADVFDDITAIARALGVEQRGVRLTVELRAAFAQPQVKGYRPRILVEWWPKPVIVPGRLSWVNDMIGSAGGINPLGEREVESAPIGDEEIVALAPDAVVIAWCGVPAVKYRPEVVRRRTAWQGVPALAQDRIFCISEALLGRPGPRLVEGLQALREVVVRCREDN